MEQRDRGCPACGKPIVEMGELTLMDLGYLQQMLDSAGWKVWLEIVSAQLGAAMQRFEAAGKEDLVAAQAEVRSLRLRFQMESKLQAFIVAKVRQIEERNGALSDEELEGGGGTNEVAIDELTAELLKVSSRDLEE